jgi:hypothetical protein
MSDGPLTRDELVGLEARVLRALHDPEHEAEHVRVLGYGEISCVVAFEADAGHYACKRLPRFPGDDDVDSYRGTFFRYLEALREGGVVPVDSWLQATPTDGGTALYCVQPILSPDSLLPNMLRDVEDAKGHDLLERVVRATRGAISPRLGLDAQLSNWAWVEGELRYLDVTTPLLRDERGASELDTDLFLAALPWLLRPLVRTFLLKEILSHYFAPRPALKDLAANLHKERLVRWIPTVLELANAEREESDAALTEDECARYYKEDARTWALLLALRRMDRAWQRRVRRRTYPFLLPGPVER